MKQAVLMPLAVVTLLAMVAGCHGDRSTRDPENERPQVANQELDAKRSRPIAQAPVRVRKLALVTNNASIYWKAFANGVHKYERQHDVPFVIMMPANGMVGEQDDIIERLISEGYDGIAVSPLNRSKQSQALNDAALKSRLITFDYDAPRSERLVFVGVDYRETGRKLGKEIVKLLPAGGKIAIFVGAELAEMAAERVQRLRDALANHSIEIALAREDGTDRRVALKNVQDVLASRPDINLLCGIWSYNGPAIAEALRGSGRQRKVLAVCFDEEERTLDAIGDGTIQCTVILQPFEMGYRAAEWLDKVTRNKDGAAGAGIPEDKFVRIDSLVVDPSNVEKVKAQVADWQK